MTRTIVLGASSVLLAAAVVAATQAGTDNKLVSLAKAEEWDAKDGKASKMLTIDTTGYSEARFTIQATPIGKKDFGKSARGELTVHTGLGGGGYGPIAGHQLIVNGKPALFQLADAKVRSNKTLLSLGFYELEAEKLSVSIDVYLVK